VCCCCKLKQQLKPSFAFFFSTFQTSTIGLVTLDEMKAKQEVIVQEREKQLAKKLKEKEREIERELEAKQAEKKKQKQQIQALSFKLDEDEEQEEYSDQEEIVSFLGFKGFCCLKNYFLNFSQFNLNHQLRQLSLKVNQ
jgi:hypothetical protein